MTARRDPDRLIRAYLEDGPTELPDRSYDEVRSQIDHTRQRVAIGRWTEPRMNNFARFAIAVAAVLVVAVIGITLLPNQGGIGGVPTPTPSPSPSPTASPAAFPGAGPLAAGRYTDTPFLGNDASMCGPEPTGATPPPCTEATRDDAIRFTFTVPDGWAGISFLLALASEGTTPPGGAGMIFGRGGWLHSDPCLTDAQIALNDAPPDVPVGPGVDDFANALAEHPLLDVTAPVDVTLAGYAGKYVDLQVPSDISACAAYFPWEGGGGPYAQGPSHRWHLWILDVDDVRVVVQAMDYAGTSPQRQAELGAIVDSIQITP